MNLFSINDDKLISLNKCGILPGPGENKEEFLKRGQNLFKNDPSADTKTFLNENLKKLFDVSFDWISFEYTRKGMHFWEAAYVKIDKDQFIMRLNKVFEKKTKYLGMYAKDEVIAHECCHVARMRYPESKFEEIFAYSLSTGFRKFFGPIFQNSFESLLLILLVGFSAACDLYFSSSLKLILASKATLGSYLGVLLVRLFTRRRTFSKCLKKIKGLVKDQKHAMPLLFRLQDCEIVLFSRASIGEVKEYISEQSELRWEMICKLYPIK